MMRQRSREWYPTGSMDWQKSSEVSKRDNLYATQDGKPAAFRFDEQVVAVFPDMINRSVPGYALIVPMIGQLARRYVQPDSIVHDLGSSLGAVCLSVQHGLQGRQDLGETQIIATDNSPAMVRRFNELLEAHQPGATNLVPITSRLADIREVEIINASLVVLNFTLQFLGLEERDALLQRIAEGLRPGGVLVLAEKICFDDTATQHRQTDWHHDYKRLQGYSEMEIAGKRAALEEVLKTESEETHLARLKNAGFRRVTRWFQCFGFCAWLAEK